MHLKTLGKYYIVDTGIRSLLTSGSARDTGHLKSKTDADIDKFE